MTVDCIPCLPFEDFEPVPFADPDCEHCGGDGKITKADVFTLEQSLFETCSCVEGDAAADVGTLYPSAHVDSDLDGWLDGVAQVPARYAGPRMPLHHIESVVIHSLWKGKWGQGPRYLSNPGDGRFVSVHFCTHKPGRERRLTQMVPISRVAWHAGNRYWNRHSLSVEHDGPFGEPDQYDEQWQVTYDLIASLQALCPNLQTIRTHRSITPLRRKDTGPHFPYEKFEGLGLQIVV